MGLLFSLPVNSCLLGLLILDNSLAPIKLHYSSLLFHSVLIKYNMVITQQDKGELVSSDILSWQQRFSSSQWIAANLEVCLQAERETLSLEELTSLFLDLQSRVPPSFSPHLYDSAPASLPPMLWRERICQRVGVFVCMIVCVYIYVTQDLGGVVLEETEVQLFYFFHAACYLHDL